MLMNNGGIGLVHDARMLWLVFSFSFSFLGLVRLFLIGSSLSQRVKICRVWCMSFDHVDRSTVQKSHEFVHVEFARDFGFHSIQCSFKGSFGIDCMEEKGGNVLQRLLGWRIVQEQINESLFVQVLFVGGDLTKQSSCFVDHGGVEGHPCSVVFDRSES
jgi:hypothetical protein